jgi:hypothetical protein
MVVWEAGCKIMNEFTILASRFLACDSLDEFTVAAERAGQLVEQLVRAKKLDIDHSIVSDCGNETDYWIGFMIYCDRLEERYIDFPRNAEGINPTIANNNRSQSMDFSQRKYSYADVCVWLSKFLQVESVAGQSGKIPPENRSRPLQKHEAARLYRQSVKWLTACMNDGTIKFEMKSRQSFIFDVTEFPAESQHKARTR